MNRLQAELQRLYLSPGAEPQAPGPAGPDDGVRAMVLELARPASWDSLARVWQGVQADLELPAPAIAVSGCDGYQLWFSLCEPVPAAQASSFLESLRRRYLGDVRPERLAMQSGPGQHLGPLPPVEREPGHWSAFLAPDLAALFADEPWLDLPPGADAQAELLSRLQSTKADDFRRALERLGPADLPASSPTAAATGAAAGRADTRSQPVADGLDPRRFLLAVMNDPAVALQLRMEAAKALLPYFEGQRPL